MFLPSPNLMRFTRPLAYSPPRLWQVLGDDGQAFLQWDSRPQGLWRHAATQWVIDRSQCIFRCLDLSHVPRAQRAQALSVKLAGLSPFRVPGFHTVWRGGQVMLWLWDQEVQQGLVAAEPDLPRHYRCLPESVVQGAVAISERPYVRLLEVKRGADLQVWKAGVLVQSIHYPGTPSSQQIGLLARGIADLDASSSPEIVREDYLAAPWGVGWQSMQGEWERWVPHSLLAGLLLGCSVQLAQGIAWWSESRSLQGEHARLVEQIEPLLEARNRAQQTSTLISQLQARMQSQYLQIELLRKVGSLLPADTRLLGWRMRSDELELQIATENRDPRFYVQRLQDDGHFQQVRVEPDPAGNGLRLQMSLREGSSK